MMIIAVLFSFKKDDFMQSTITKIVFYWLVFYPYVTGMYLVCTRMLVVCTRMYSYVTRMYSCDVLVTIQLLYHIFTNLEVQNVNKVSVYITDFAASLG